MPQPTLDPLSTKSGGITYTLGQPVEFGNPASLNQLSPPPTTAGGYTLGPPIVFGQQPAPTAPASDTGALGQAYGSLVRGFTGTIASLPEAMGLWAYNLERKYGTFGDLEEGATAEDYSGLLKVGGGIRKFGEAITPEESRKWGGSFWATDVPSGIGTVFGFMVGTKGIGGGARLLGGGAKGATARATASVEAASAARMGTQATLKTTKGVSQKAITRGYGLGGKSAAVRAAIAGDARAINMAALATTGSAVQAVEGWNDAYATMLARANAEGRSELSDEELDKAWSAFKWNAPAGAIEAFGAEGIALKLFRNLDKGTRGAWGRGLRHTFKQAGKGAAREATQESIQTAWMNMTAAEIAKYDENRGLFEGVVRAGGVGGVIGAIFGGVTASVTRKAENQRRILALTELQGQLRETGNTKTADALQQRINDLKKDMAEGTDAEYAYDLMRQATEEFKENERLYNEEQLEELINEEAPHLIENKDGTITEPIADGWEITTESEATKATVLGVNPKEFEEIEEEVPNKKAEAKRDAIGKRLGARLKEREEAFEAGEDVDLIDDELERIEKQLKAADQDFADNPIIKIKKSVPKLALDVLRYTLKSPTGETVGTGMTKFEAATFIYEEIAKEEALKPADEAIYGDALAERVAEMREQEEREDLERRMGRGIDFMGMELSQQKTLADELDRQRTEVAENLESGISKLGLTTTERGNYTGGDVVVIPDEKVEAPTPLFRIVGGKKTRVKADEQPAFLPEIGRIKYEVVETGPAIKKKGQPELEEGQLLLRNLKTGKTKVSQDSDTADAMQQTIGGKYVVTQPIAPEVAAAPVIDPEVELGEGEVVEESPAGVQFAPDRQAGRRAASVRPTSERWSTEALQLGAAKTYGFVEDLGDGNYAPKVRIIPENGDEVTMKDVRMHGTKVVRAIRSHMATELVEESEAALLAKLDKMLEEDAQQILEEYNTDELIESRQDMFLDVPTILSIRDMIATTKVITPAFESVYKKGEGPTPKAKITVDEIKKAHKFLTAHAKQPESKAATFIKVDQVSKKEAVKKLKAGVRLRGRLKEYEKKALIIRRRIENNYRRAGNLLEPMQKELKEANERRTKFWEEHKDVASLNNRQKGYITGLEKKIDSLTKRIAPIEERRGRQRKELDAFGNKEVAGLPEDYNTLNKINVKRDELKASEPELETAALKATGRVSPITLGRKDQFRIIKGTHAGRSYRAYQSEDGSIFWHEIEMDSDFVTAKQAEENIKESENSFIVFHEDSGVTGSIDLPVSKAAALASLREHKGKKHRVAYVQPTFVRGGKDVNQKRKILHKNIIEAINRSTELAKFTTGTSGVGIDVAGEESIAFLRRPRRYVGLGVMEGVEESLAEAKAEKAKKEKEARDKLMKSVAVWRSKNASPTKYITEKGEVLDPKDPRVKNEFSEADLEVVNAFLREAIEMVMPNKYYDGLKFDGLVMTLAGRNHKAVKEGSHKAGDAVFVKASDPNRIYINPKMLLYNPKTKKGFYKVVNGRLVGKRPIGTVVFEELSHLLDIQVIGHLIKTGKVQHKTVPNFLRSLFKTLSRHQVEAIITQYSSKTKTTGWVEKEAMGFKVIEPHKAGSVTPQSDASIMLEGLRMIREGRGPIFLETDITATNDHRFRSMFSTVQELSDSGAFEGSRVIKSYLETANYYIGLRQTEESREDMVYVVDNIGGKHAFPDTAKGNKDAIDLAERFIMSDEYNIDKLSRKSRKEELEEFRKDGGKGGRIISSDGSVIRAGKFSDEVNYGSKYDAAVNSQRRINDLVKKLHALSFSEYPPLAKIRQEMEDQGIVNWGQYAVLKGLEEARKVWGANGAQFDHLKAHTHQSAKEKYIRDGFSEKDAALKATSSYITKHRGETMLEDAELFYLEKYLNIVDRALNDTWRVNIQGTGAEYEFSEKGKEKAIDHAERILRAKLADAAAELAIEEGLIEREQKGAWKKDFEAAGYGLKFGKETAPIKEKKAELKVQEDILKDKSAQHPLSKKRQKATAAIEILKTEIKRMERPFNVIKGNITDKQLRKMAEKYVIKSGVEEAADGTYPVRLVPYDDGLRSQYIKEFLTNYRNKHVRYQDRRLWPRHENTSSELSEQTFDEMVDSLSSQLTHNQIVAPSTSSLSEILDQAQDYNLRLRHLARDGVAVKPEEYLTKLESFIAAVQKRMYVDTSMHIDTDGDVDLAIRDAPTAGQVREELVKIAREFPTGNVSQLMLSGELSVSGKKAEIHDRKIRELMLSASFKILKLHNLESIIDDEHYGANLEEDVGSPSHLAKQPLQSESVTPNSPVSDKKDNLGWRWWSPATWGAVDMLKINGFNALAERIEAADNEKDDIFGDLAERSLRVLKDGGYELVGAVDPKIEGKDKTRKGLFFVTAEQGWKWADENGLNLQKAMAVPIEGYGAEGIKRAQAEFREYWMMHEKAGSEENIKENKAIAEYFLEKKASKAGRDLILWSRDNGRHQGYMMSDPSIYKDELGTGVLVRDKGDGKWRSISLMFEEYFPRVFTQDTWEIISEPNKHLDEYALMKKALVDAGRAKSMENAGKMLQEFVSDMNQAETKSDFFSNVEKARGFKLPDQFYDYSFDAYMTYLRRFSARMAQIKHFGQGAGNKPKTSWDYAAEGLGKKGREYITKLRQSVERTYGKDDPVIDFLSTIGLPIAAVTLLSGPLTSVRNTTFALRANAETFGTWNTFIASTKELVNAVTTNVKSLAGGKGMSATEQHAEAASLGMMRNDWYAVQELALGDERVQTGWKNKYLKGMSKVQKVALWMQRTTEAFNRSVTAAMSMQYLRKTRELWETSPDSSETAKHMAVLSRLGYGEEKMKALFDKDDQGQWNWHSKAVRDFIRDMTNEKQYGYNIRQHPLWLDSSGGRIFFQFQKWGFQRSRDFAKNVVSPLLVGTKVTMPDGTKKNVRDATVLWRNIFLMMAQGELYATVLRALFYDKERDEFVVPMSEKDEAIMLGASERIYKNLIYDGGFGIIGDWQAILNPMDERPSKWKNPVRPPTWSLAEEGSYLVADLHHLLSTNEPTEAKYEGVRDALDNFANTFGLYRTIDGLGANVLRHAGVESYHVDVQDAKKDVSVVRAAARDFAKMRGYEDDRVWSGGRGVQTEKKALYTELNEALLAGDHEEARIVRDRIVADRTGKERRAVLSGIKSSVRAKQPILLDGRQPTDSIQREFLRWVGKELPEYEERIDRVHGTYWKAARRAGVK